MEGHAPQYYIIQTGNLKGIEGHLKGIVQKLEDSLVFLYIAFNGWVDGECGVCAQGDGIFHVFPPDDPSPMSTHCNRWEKSFPVILSAGPDLEYLPCHQIRTRTLTDRIRIVWSPQKSPMERRRNLKTIFNLKINC